MIFPCNMKIKRLFKNVFTKGVPIMSIIAGSFYIPKDNELQPRGEDAHFILEEANTIGVADGVGGWARKGIDAGIYARKLMQNVVVEIKNQCRDVVIDPKRLLYEAFLKTEVKGSSTACIITVAGNFLRAVNLGDSGFLIIRGGKIVYNSPTQQHRFNIPYQLGKCIGKGTAEAEEITVGVKSDDIIIAGTDGLFDNIFAEDIVAVVRRCLVEENHDPEILASMLAKEARRNSLDENKATPFEAAAKLAGVKHSGGKYDDITVVVAYVVPFRL